MRLVDLSLEMHQKIAQLRFDRLIEKHEGPWSWQYWLENEKIEFLQVNGFDVLLPVEKEYHKNLTILRCIVGDQGQVLTIFLTDTTYDSGISARRVAVCEKVTGGNGTWQLSTMSGLSSIGSPPHRVLCRGMQYHLLSILQSL